MANPSVAQSAAASGLTGVAASSFVVVIDAMFSDPIACCCVPPSIGGPTASGVGTGITLDASYKLGANNARQHGGAIVSIGAPNGGGTASINSAFTTTGRQAASEGFSAVEIAAPGTITKATSGSVVVAGTGDLLLYAAASDTATAPTVPAGMTSLRADGASERLTRLATTTTAGTYSAAANENAFVFYHFVPAIAPTSYGPGIRGV